MRLTTFVAAIIAAASPAIAADATTSDTATATASASGVQSPSAQPTLGVQVSQGCFSSWGDLILNTSQKFNSRGSCANAICYAGGYNVAAMTGGSECYCGSTYPPKDTLADDDKCNVPCPGYGVEACKLRCLLYLPRCWLLIIVSFQAVESTTTLFSTLVLHCRWITQRITTRRVPQAPRVL